MRIEIIERKLYKFEELPEDIQEKAIEKLWDINVDHEWWQFTYDDAETIGLKISEFDLDRASYVNGEFTLSACEVAQNIFNNHGEDTETFKTAEQFIADWQPLFDEYMDEHSEHYESGDYEDKMMDMESEFLWSLCEDYRIILQKEYDYLTSEEAIKERIASNEYEFDEEGNLA